MHPCERLCRATGLEGVWSVDGPTELGQRLWYRRLPLDQALALRLAFAWWGRGELGIVWSLFRAQRRARQSPAFKRAVAELETFVLDRLAVDDVPLWQLRIAKEVCERIAHGLPQTVSTEYLQDRCQTAGVGGGRYYTDRPGYGT